MDSTDISRNTDTRVIAGPLSTMTIEQYVTEFLKNPEVNAVVLAVDALVALGTNYSVTTAEQHVTAGKNLQRVKAALKALEGSRTPITTRFNAALDAVNAFFKSPRLRGEATEKAIKQAIDDYDKEQERLRKEAQRKLDEAAAAERRRVEAAARETQRIADEKAAAERAEASRKREEAEAAERKAAEARAAGNRRAEAAAAAAAAAANAAAAAADRKADRVEARAVDRVANLQEQAQNVVAPVLQREQPKLSGVTTRKVPKHEITDASLLPREYLMPDEKKIRQVVLALKTDANIPGVRVWMDNQIAATAGSAA